MCLKISNVSISINRRQIINDISLTIKRGEVHVLMGPNGSGKTTISQAVMGNNLYQIDRQKGKILLDGKDLLDIPTYERSRHGLFLAFQNPVAIPGVSIAALLRAAYQSHKKNALSVFSLNEMIYQKTKTLGLGEDSLKKSLNDAFSGGEKKKLELLQAMVLSPKYAIFDEIDTGLDIDALKIVGKGIMDLIKSNTGILLITHYLRILKYVKPDRVHILMQGKIVDSGSAELAEKIEKDGYKKYAELTNGL